MFQLRDMIVISEERVKEETPVASMSSEEPTSTLAVEIPLASVRSMEIENLQVPASSSGLVQFAVRDEMTRTLQAPINSTAATQFSVRDEKARVSEQFVTLSEAMQGLGSICSMEFEASPAPIIHTGSAQFTGRVERSRTAEQLVTLSNVMEEVIEGLENFCLLEGWPGVHTRRSPLPLWYPRRPLQDITAALNIGPVPPEEASKFKKGSKKPQIVQLHGHPHDNRGGAIRQQRAPRVSFKPTSSVPTVCKRSSLLRKGFR